MAEIRDAGKARLRIMRFLAGGSGKVRPGAVAGKLLLEDKEGRTTSVDQTVLVGLLRNGIVMRQGETILLSAAASAVGARELDAKKHRDLEAVAIEVNGEMSEAIVNLSESPLGQLMRRKSRDGRPFLSRAEFEAGERLRADYTRGQLMPRLGANWVASVASGRRGGVGGGAVELTDAALAARMRVERAIAAVGPELSGVLIDVCCFLKGLELVETERGWPVRSAKIVLKSALGALSRHYRPEPASRRPERQMLHWGSDDYRPEIV